MTWLCGENISNHADLRVFFNIYGWWYRKRSYVLGWEQRCVIWSDPLVDQVTIKERISLLTNTQIYGNMRRMLSSEANCVVFSVNAFKTSHVMWLKDRWDTSTHRGVQDGRDQYSRVNSTKISRDSSHFSIFSVKKNWISENRPYSYQKWTGNLFTAGWVS